MSTVLNAAVDLDHWPGSAFSGFHTVDGVCWHVQRAGRGPATLFVHGTGASTHSFATLAEQLQDEFETISIDLPGHGFSRVEGAPDWTLPGMARGVAGLLDSLSVDPAVVIGHSAGAAILAQLCLDHDVSPNALISLNGAFIPFGGVSGTLFSSAAKLFVGLPAVPRFFARKASDVTAVQRLIQQTGSTVPKASEDCYRRLLESSDHVEAALRMMANWQLQSLYERLPELKTPLHLFSADRDRTIPSSQAARIATWLPRTRLHALTGLGHLAHEEDPALHARMIREIWVDAQAERVVGR